MSILIICSIFYPFYELILFNYLPYIWLSLFVWILKFYPFLPWFFTFWNIYAYMYRFKHGRHNGNHLICHIVVDDIWFHKLPLQFPQLNRAAVDQTLTYVLVHVYWYNVLNSGYINTLVLGSSYSMLYWLFLFNLETKWRAYLCIWRTCRGCRQQWKQNYIWSGRK